MKDLDFENIGKKIKALAETMCWVGIVIWVLIGIILIVLSLIFLLPKMMNKEYYLVLNGDTDIVIKQNTPYIEAGFNAKDNKGNNLQNQVIIEGEISSLTYSQNKQDKISGGTLLSKIFK